MPDSPSSLARYRPVVYVTVGVAAALTFYSFYTSFQTANPSSNLHRSNAIQRPRRQRSSNLRSAENRTQNESFLHDNSGLWHVPITLPDGHTEILPISQTFTGLPTLQGLQVQYGVDDETAERLRYELELAVVGSYLRSNYPDRQRFMVLDPDVPNITDYLESRGISRQAIRNGYELINREQSTSAPLVDGTNDQDGRETIAGTEVSWETTGGIPHPDQSQSTDAQNLKSMLYYIAEDQARQDGYVHRGVTCNACDMKPIRGVRWRCANCPDYDLCSDCEASGVHIKTHVFYKIRIPAPSSTRQAQPVMYPGKPTLMATYLPAEVKKRLCFETKFEPAEVDAYWDQFTCLANTIWEADPDGLRGAIDRKAFDKSFAHFYASMPPIPNLIYDRAFSLYDSNADNYIGFSEFLTTLSVLQSRQPNKKLRKIYNGYDLDGDGLVSRRDFLRIFRANFALQREITREAIMCQQDELSAAGAMNVVLSSQPLSSAFADIIPPGDPSRPIIGKSIGRYGDEKWTYSGVTFENVDETVTRAEIIRRAESARTGGSLGSAEDDSNDDAIEKRWLRREFYVDEEEGLSPPPGFENETDEDEDESEDDDEVIGSLAGGAETDSRNVSSRQISPRSRSSSKVRFQDDLEFETRSNASTSSRPMNERWGGYEIPEAERDLGKDVLYQVTQQGLNELLDTLFREKEDLAVEVKVTKQERRTYRSKISEYSGQQKESTLQADMHAQDESIKAALQDEDMARKLLMEYLREDYPSLAEAISRAELDLEDFVNALKKRLKDHAKQRIGLNTETAGEILTLLVHGSISEEDVVDTAYELLTLVGVTAYETEHEPPAAPTSQEDNGESLMPLSDELVRDATTDGVEFLSTSIENNGFFRISTNPEAAVWMNEFLAARDAREGDIQGMQELTSHERSNEIQPRRGALQPGAPAPASSSAQPQASPAHFSQHNAGLEQRDPTMPQFRPNSLTDLEQQPESDIQPETTSWPRLRPRGRAHNTVRYPMMSPDMMRALREYSHPAQENGIPEPAAQLRERSTHLKTAHERRNDHQTPPDETRLKRLVFLEEVERESRLRGGGGKLSWQEFEKIYKENGGRTGPLGFIEGWLEIATF